MGKDWTGGKHSVFTTLGASNHSSEERESNDYYATHPDAINYLKKKIELPHLILEPACGEGHLSERLKELGHEVMSYDIVDRGYGEVQNFFEMLTAPTDKEFAIVTNPPYKWSLQFVLHSLELLHDGMLVCMFLKTTFLEGKRRYNELFRFTPPPMRFAVRRANSMRQKWGL